MSKVIFSAQYWPTNAHLIADVAKLGYLGIGKVLDATYGQGVFWKEHKFTALNTLITLDKFTPAMVKGDFTNLPFADGTFQAVVDDPPYKFNGTPSPFEKRYGVHLPTRWQDRLSLIIASVKECARVVAPKGHLLVKCMDQVVSGKVVWQTDWVTRAALDSGMKKVDRFDFLVNPREQPHERQVHSRRNYSSLLVFRKIS